MDASAFEPWFTEHEVYDFRSSQTADAGTGYRFQQALLDRGVLKAHEKFFVSTAHGEEEVALTLRAFEEVAAVLAEEIHA